MSPDYSHMIAARYFLGRGAEDLPGMGQFYCIACSRYFQSAEVKRTAAINEPATQRQRSRGDQEQLEPRWSLESNSRAHDERCAVALRLWSGLTACWGALPLASGLMGVMISPRCTSGA